MRNGLLCRKCPISTITPWSLSCLEHFEAWKRFGCVDVMHMDAKVADALAVLDKAWGEELKRVKE
jgi:hypothetical protein